MNKFFSSSFSVSILPPASSQKAECGHFLLAGLRLFQDPRRLATYPYINTVLGFYLLPLMLHGRNLAHII